MEAIKVRLSFLCIALAVGVAAAAAPAGAQTPVGDVAKGQLASQGYCGNCHAIVRSQSRSPHPGAKPFATIAQRPELSAMTLSVWLKSSHPNMPLLRLETETIEDIAAYLLTMKPARAAD
jgi:mono/diheme cytochrome c family protein